MPKLVKVNNKWEKLNDFPSDYRVIELPEGADSPLDCDFNTDETQAFLNEEKKQQRLIMEEQARIAQQTEWDARRAIKQRITQYKNQAELLQTDISAMANLADAKVVLGKLTLGFTNLVDDIGKIAQRTI
jgi:hypothetical protein